MAPSSGPFPLAELGLPIVRIVAVAVRITWAIIVRHADSEAAIPDADIEALRACGHSNPQRGRRRQSESKFSHDAFLLCFGPHGGKRTAGNFVCNRTNRGLRRTVGRCGEMSGRRSSCVQERPRPD